MTNDQAQGFADRVEHIAAGVQYHAIEGVQGRYFRCDPYRATLRIAACRDRFERAQVSQGQGLDALIKCRACLIGAQHAGSAVTHFSPIYGSMICPRCGKGTTRMIQNLVCVSCRNRELEFLKGRNGKGTAPVKLTNLSRRTVRAQIDGGRVIERTVERCADSVEAMADALRKVPGRLLFTRSRRSPLIEQSRPL